MMVSDCGIEPGRRSGRKESCGAILRARFVRAAVEWARNEAATICRDADATTVTALLVEVAERAVEGMEEVLLVRRRPMGRMSE
jgi:hypothetical protein